MIKVDTDLYMMLTLSLFRQDILAGVNGGLVVASFLAAMTSSLFVPWVSSGVSRLLESGLPRVEITLPDNEAINIINSLAGEEEDMEDMEDMEDSGEMGATNKVKRSIRFKQTILT